MSFFIHSSVFPHSVQNEWPLRVIFSPHHPQNLTGRVIDSGETGDLEAVEADAATSWTISAQGCWKAVD